MELFVVTVDFGIKPEFFDEFLSRVRRQASDSLSLEPECRHFDVCVGLGAPSKLFLYEVYDSEAAFDRHLSSEHFLAFNDEVTPWVESKTVSKFKLLPDAE
ncbi:MAG: antibiotic biosynthesis monooxygenase [Rhodobacteraceae bacterium]|nr:antibiotic biosynthesis monooxygenase [Paracoccaceae bacterium]